MSTPNPIQGQEIAAQISASGLSIYDPILQGSPLFFDIGVLESLLQQKLINLELNYKIRTRAKVAKQAVAEALGYPVPRSFKHTQPRFPGQNLDVYVQQSNNLQIWNAKVSSARRYAVIVVDTNNVVKGVRVLTGETLALHDKTGTLTRKFQAKRRPTNTGSLLVSQLDTVNFRSHLAPVDVLSSSTLAAMNAAGRPCANQVLSIQAIYNKLQGLVGRRIDDPGVTQERNRGAALHRLACETLGLVHVGDTAQFPDILCQAIEVKLQTSPTIDLGMVSPDSMEIAQEVGSEIQHRDIRYVVAYGKQVDGNQVEITAIVVATGEQFFTEFQKFAGKVVNSKLQIRLPASYFA